MSNEENKDKEVAENTVDTVEADTTADANANVVDNDKSGAGESSKKHYPPALHHSFTTPDYESRNTLDGEQRAKFDEMCEAMEFDTMTAKQRAFCDDRCLRRYLVARDWNVKKASTLLKSTLVWRDEFKPDEITADEMNEEASWGKMYRRGFDKLGRPVLVARPVGKTSELWDVQLRYVTHNFESAIATMGPGVEQIVWLIDYSGFSLSAAPPMHFSKSVLTTMSDHYPERLGAIYALNPPMMFRILWGALSPLLNQRTKSKIHFLTGDDAKKRDILLKHFDAHVLESDFLGDNESGYDHEEYWPRATELYEERVKASHKRTLSAAAALGIEHKDEEGEGSAKLTDTADKNDGSGDDDNNTGDNEKKAGDDNKE